MKKQAILFLLLMFSVLSNASDDKEIKEILAANKGDVLAPENLDESKYDGFEVGDSFSLRWEGIRDKPFVVKYVLEEIEGEHYHFESYEGEKYVPHRRMMFHDGDEYRASSKEGDFSRNMSGCLIVIGKCKMKYIRDEITVDTEFKDGVWYSVRPGPGLSKTRIISIFDKNGIVLYRHYIARVLSRDLSYKIFRE